MRRFCQLHADAGAADGSLALIADQPQEIARQDRVPRLPRQSAAKKSNHALSRFRVRVEHIFAKLKAFRMLSRDIAIPGQPMPPSSPSSPASSISPQALEQ